jgi:hypothetical protein
VILVQLMMACNDMTIANESLAAWRAEQPGERAYRQLGAMRYFVRMQMSHLFEGLKIIEKIKDSPDLHAMVGRCDAQTQASFRFLEEYLPRGPHRADFERLLGRIRNNIGFHYDDNGRLIARALAAAAAEPHRRHSSITRGSTAHLWRFEPADEIVDRIVVRQIWGIPVGADVSAEADRIVVRLHDIQLKYVDFAGEFIWKLTAR